jgi:acetyl esterase
METQTPAEARSTMSRMMQTLVGAPLPVTRVETLSLPGPAGPLAARLYVPPGDTTPCPLLVYYHGGGWVIGDLDTHDAVCRFLAREAAVRVLSVEYRLAPEHVFPAAADDAEAAFRYAHAEAAALGADPRRIGVGGDSAGGNLAAVVAQRLRGGPAPAFQLLFYPVTDLSKKHPSYRLFSNGFFLTEPQMDWFRNHYLAHERDAQDPSASPLLAKDVSGLAPAHVVTAGFDVLRDEGEAYAARLREAGVAVTLTRHPGQIHGFCNLASLLRSADLPMREAAAALRRGLHAT